jgi:hypothetical protein
MGYIRQHAIIVTSWDEDKLGLVHLRARELTGSLTSMVTHGLVNDQHSFFVAPDGSKEGWDISNQLDEDRDRLITYMQSFAYEDGSNPISWVEVVVCDEDGEPRVTRSN